MDEQASEGKVTNTTKIVNHPFVVEWEAVGWAVAAIGVAAIVCSLIWSICIYNMSAHDKMAEAIKNGSNPTDVYCAFGGSSDNKICLVRAAVSGKEVK